MHKDLKHWTRLVDQLFTDKGIHPNNDKKSKIIRMFYNTFLKEGWYQHSIFGDGLQMMEILADQYEFAPSLDSNWRCNATDVIPELRDNQTWNNMLQALVSVTMKGVGVGEMFLTLAHPNAKYDGAKDLVIDNKEIECKKTQGGCLKGNEKSNHRVIDRLRNELDLPHERGQKLEDVYQRLAKFPKTTQEYFWKTLYPDFTDVDILTLMSLDENIEQARFKHGLTVLKAYRDIDNFDALLLVSDEEDPDITFITDFKDEAFLKENIKFDPKLRRGGDTNAVGDGYVVIKTQKAA